MPTEHNSDPNTLRAKPPEAGVTGQLIKITTALAVAAVAAVAAVISYRHAYESSPPTARPPIPRATVTSPRRTRPG